MTHYLKKFKKTEDLGQWYDQKYTDMGGCWQTTREDCLKHIEYMGATDLDLEKFLTIAILDVGFGNATLLQVLNDLDDSIITVGIEASEVAILLAHGTKSYLIKGDIETFKPSGPYIPRHYNFITSIGTIEHLIHLDKALKNIYKLLTPDGKFYVYAPNELWTFEDQPQEQTHTNGEWVDIFQKAGFNIIKYERDGNNTRFLMGKKQ